MRCAVTQVRPGGARISERNQAFRQPESIRHVLRITLHHGLQQLETGLGVAVRKQCSGRHHVQRPEQALSRAGAKLRVELGAPPRVAFDFGDQAGRREPRDLSQPPGDDRATQSVLGGHHRLRPHALVRELTICMRIGAAGDERFECVGHGEDGQVRATQRCVHRPAHGRIRGRTGEHQRCENDQHADNAQAASNHGYGFE